MKKNIDILTVVAHIKSKKGFEKQVREAFHSLVHPTRAEEGCMDYVFHESEDDPCSFVFYENWESRAHLDLHLKTEHIKKVAATAGDFLAEPVKISLWRKIS